MAETEMNVRATARRMNYHYSTIVCLSGRYLTLAVPWKPSEWPATGDYPWARCHIVLSDQQNHSLPLAKQQDHWSVCVFKSLDWQPYDDSEVCPTARKPYVGPNQTPSSEAAKSRESFNCLHLFLFNPLPELVFHKISKGEIDAQHRCNS